MEISISITSQYFTIHEYVAPDCFWPPVEKQTGALGQCISHYLCFINLKLLNLSHNRFNQRVSPAHVTRARSGKIRDFIYNFHTVRLNRNKF